MNPRTRQELAHDIECGILHTGIPPCCVAFFLTEWEAWDAEQRHAHLEPVRPPNFGVGYVPCPECMTGGYFVAARPCGCGETFQRGVEWARRRA